MLAHVRVDCLQRHVSVQALPCFLHPHTRPAHRALVRVILLDQQAQPTIADGKLLSLFEVLDAEKKALLCLKVI